jgi:hypothetical protein
VTIRVYDVKSAKFAKRYGMQAGDRITVGVDGTVRSHQDLELFSGEVKAAVHAGDLEEVASASTPQSLLEEAGSLLREAIALLEVTAPKPERPKAPRTGKGRAQLALVR